MSADGAQAEQWPRASGGFGVTRFATRGDQRLSFESGGENDGTPVILLHDLLADRGQLRPLGVALTEVGFRVTLPDIRGHGASPMIAGRGYPLSALANDVLAVMDAENLAATHVVAFGWAASIALELAARSPRRVDSLVLVTPNMPALIADLPVDGARRYGAAQEEIIREAADAAYKGLTDRALDLYLGIRWGSDWRDRLTKPRLGAIRRAAANLAPLLEGMAPKGLDRDALRAVGAPVTIFLRTEPPAFERWNAEALAALVPGASVQSATISSDDGRSSITPEWAPVLLRVLVGKGR